MGIPEYEDLDATSIVAERLNSAEASLVVEELKHHGIEARVLALPENREFGPYDVSVGGDEAHAAWGVIQRIEVIEEPDTFLSDRPAWLRALAVTAGIIAVLIPLFFALIAILGS